MFPGISPNLAKCNNYEEFPELQLGCEIKSELLFCNVCYFPCWLMVAVTATVDMYLPLKYLYKFILVTDPSVTPCVK